MTLQCVSHTRLRVFVLATSNKVAVSSIPFPANNAIIVEGTHFALAGHALRLLGELIEIS